MMIDTGGFQEQMHTRFFRSLSFSISFSMSFSVSFSLSLFLSLGVSVSCTTIKCNYGQFDEIFSGGFDVQKADSTTKGIQPRVPESPRSNELWQSGNRT